MIRLFIGQRLGEDRYRRRMDQNQREPRAWGVTLGWTFIGIVTFPNAQNAQNSPLATEGGSK